MGSHPMLDGFLFLYKMLSLNCTLRLLSTGGDAEFRFPIELMEENVLSCAVSI